LIEADRITFRYPERLKPALKDLSFSVRQGESVLVLGPSGSGKSTLTLCLDGLIPHVVEGELAGTVTVADLSTVGHPVHLLAQHVGLVFQDPEAQFCTLTVEDEVAFGLENVLTAPDIIETKIDEALDVVGLAGFRKRRLDTLSGGEQQRVALASVLAMGPSILVLDEPSANLDPAGTREIFSFLGRLARTREHTIVIVEHKLDEIIEWIDSVLVLGPTGSVLFRGSPRTAFYQAAESLCQAGVWHPRITALARRLKGAGWEVPGEPLTLGEAATALEKTRGLLPRLRRRSIAPPRYAEILDAAMPNVVMSIRHLSFSYPHGPQVLKDVSFSLGSGELVAIVGANGAGKSTLASLLSGVLRPPRGAVFLQGHDIRDLKDSSLAAEVGYVFQNPEHQFVSDTVRGELAYSLAHSRHGALTAEHDDLIEATLLRFGLKRLEQANPFSLSQGQKRRLSVAAMLVRAQSVLFLDEPTFGQDQAQAARLMGMLQELWQEGRAIVVATHDMDLVAEYCHRVLVLRDGRLLFCGAPRDFFSRDDVVAEAELGRPALAHLSSLLARRHGTDPALLTVADYLAAASHPDPEDGLNQAAPATLQGRGVR
jgi:energy-coupling factor transporter ATP-binding protein EcfA2